MADIKVAYGSSAALTLTLASLATDANLLAGRESTAIVNTSNKYTDYLVGGKITTGTSPTAAKQILVYAYGSIDDTPTFPDSLTGADAGKTFTSADIRESSLRLLAVLQTDNTSNRAYWMAPTSILTAFGGVMPKQFGIFVVHNTGVNLHATGGNHAISATGIYHTSA